MHHFLEKNIKLMCQGKLGYCNTYPAGTKSDKPLLPVYSSLTRFYTVS